MTTREQKIAKAILDYLHEAEFGQRTQLQIHGGAFAAFEQPRPSVDEVKCVLENLNTEGWIRGVPDRFKKMLWNITPLGDSVRLEM